MLLLLMLAIRAAHLLHDGSHLVHHIQHLFLLLRLIFPCPIIWCISPIMWDIVPMLFIIPYPIIPCPIMGCPMPPCIWAKEIPGVSIKAAAKTMINLRIKFPPDVWRICQDLIQSHASWS